MPELPSAGSTRPKMVMPFRGVMDAVRSNKKAAWGYDFVDASDKVDPSQPPSWSKILAVRSQLGSHDWVFWNDADSLATNPNITLEGVLRLAIGHGDFETSPDLVVTEGINEINTGTPAAGTLVEATGG